MSEFGDEYMIKSWEKFWWLSFFSDLAKSLQVMLLKFAQDRQVSYFFHRVQLCSSWTLPYMHIPHWYTSCSLKQGSCLWCKQKSLNLTINMESEKWHKLYCRSYRNIQSKIQFSYLFHKVKLCSLLTLFIQTHCPLLHILFSDVGQLLIFARTDVV